MDIVETFSTASRHKQNLWDTFNLDTAENTQAEEGDLQHKWVLEAARKRGIHITDISDQMLCKAAILEWNGQVELLVKGVISSSMHLKTKFFCDFKQAAKGVFKHLKIPAPPSILFRHPDESEVRKFIQKGKKYVCKPQNACNGIGVEMGITSFQQIRNYWQRNHHLEQAFLLEEQVEGIDLRLQIIDRRVVASCTRVPAYVTGDGVHTLIQLAKQRQKAVHEQNPSDRLELDRASFALIESQGLALGSIPAAGRRIQLKEVSNIGQGGHAIDVSDEIHPRYYEWTQRIIDFCDASFFAFDLICLDHTKDPEDSESKTVALEINALAEWTHHSYSERRTHDLATLVIDTTFSI